MRELRLLYYRKGFALADYDKYWDDRDFNLSGYISLMKVIPKEEHKSLIIPLAKGWATWINKCLAERGLQIDIIVRAFGHNEMEHNPHKPMSIIASLVAQETGAEFRMDIIKKTRQTDSQTYLNYDKNRWRREKNVKNSIAATEAYFKVEGKSILVLDDIKTTGSTLREIGRALNAGLKNKLYFLTLGEPREFPAKNIELFNHLNNALDIY